MTAVLPNPFEVQPETPAAAAESVNAFDAHFDAQRFLEEIEAAPVFISNPRPEFLRSAEAVREFNPIFDIIRGVSHA